MRQCPRCGLPFDSVHAAGQHAWKQQDDAHDDVDSLDEGILLVANGNSDGESPDDVGAESPSPNRVDDGGSTVTHDGERGTTDGGRRAPPVPDMDVEPDYDDQEADTRDVDDLPERYVSVETYLAEVSDAVGDERAEQLRAMLSDHDVVDVVETDETTIVAHPINEVPA